MRLVDGRSHHTHCDSHIHLRLSLPLSLSLLSLSLSAHSLTCKISLLPSLTHTPNNSITQWNEVGLTHPMASHPILHPCLLYVFATNYRNSGGRITKEGIQHIPCSGIPRCFEWPLASPTEKGSHFNLQRERGLAKNRVVLKFLLVDTHTETWQLSVVNKEHDLWKEMGLSSFNIISYLISLFLAPKYQHYQEDTWTQSLNTKYATQNYLSSVHVVHAINNKTKQRPRTCFIRSFTSSMGSHLPCVEWKASFATSRARSPTVIERFVQLLAWCLIGVLTRNQIDQVWAE